MSQRAASRKKRHSSKTPSELALLRYYRSGDAESFSVVAEELDEYLIHAALDALPRQVAGRWELAEDARQETLWKLAHGLTEVPYRWRPSRGASLKSWAWCICQNHAIDLLRRKQNRLLTATDFFAAQAKTESGITPLLGATVEDDCAEAPDEALLAREAYEQAMLLLAEQPERERGVFVGVLSGESYESLSSKFDCANATISRVVARLCARLSGKEIPSKGAQDRQLR